MSLNVRLHRPNGLMFTACAVQLVQLQCLNENDQFIGDIKSTSHHSWKSAAASGAPTRQCTAWAYSRSSNATDGASHTATPAENQII